MTTAKKKPSRPKPATKAGSPKPETARRTRIKTKGAKSGERSGRPVDAKPGASPSGSTGDGERLNRFLAQSGQCSRREADKLIAAGKVSINGQQVEDMGRRVKPGDKVCVDGKPVARLASHTYLLYNKPAGQLCTRRDDKGRDLIYKHIEVGPNVQSVGRLDMDSEGLLLLTDDGELANLMTRPGSGVAREYRVRVTGHPSLETIEALRSGGLDIGEGETSDPWEVVIDSETGGHTWLTVIIRRGRNREVRRTMEAAGHTVRRLIRTRFGPLKLEEGVKPGSSRHLNAGEVRHLRRSIGLGEKAS